MPRDYTYNSIKDRAATLLAPASRQQIDAMKREADFVKSVRGKLGEPTDGYRKVKPKIPGRDGAML